MTEQDRDALNAELDQCAAELEALLCKVQRISQALAGLAAA